MGWYLLFELINEFEENCWEGSKFWYLIGKVEFRDRRKKELVVIERWIYVVGWKEGKNLYKVVEIFVFGLLWIEGIVII